MRKATLIFVVVICLLVCTVAIADEEEVLWCEAEAVESQEESPGPPCYGDSSCCYDLAYSEVMPACLEWVGGYIAEICGNMTPPPGTCAGSGAYCEEWDLACRMNAYSNCLAEWGYGCAAHLMQYQAVDICANHISSWLWACQHGS